MSKTAWIFPGQGAQKAGMGKDFYENSSTARAVIDKASVLLDLDMKALCFEKNCMLDETEYTQAAMVTVCLAMAAELRERGLEPDVTAGLSLGEYCAIATAKGMDEEAAIKTVRKRGIFMQNAVPGGKGAMAAVLGLGCEVAEAVIEGIEGVSIANYNCPGQIVISGYKDKVTEAAEALKAAGAKKAVLLNVSGPFHSPLLEVAGRALGRELEKVEFKSLKIPYVTNVTASCVENPAEIKNLLEKQVSSPVRWQQSVEKMLEMGADTFVEIGPGSTLAGFMKRIDRTVKVHNVSTWEDVDRLALELSGE